MRQEYEWLLSRLDPTGGEGRSKAFFILDFGPMEGAEVSALVSLGHSVDAFNMKGKTPVKEASYFPLTSLKKLPFKAKKFDVVTCIHALGFIGTGAFSSYGRGHLGREFRRVLKDKGRLFLAACVGAPKVARTRAGYLHVFDREEIYQLFGAFTLKEEMIIADGHTVEWEAVAHAPGVVNKEVRQFGLFEFVKPASKGGGRGKGKKTQTDPKPPAEKTDEDNREEYLLKLDEVRAEPAEV